MGFVQCPDFIARRCEYFLNEDKKIMPEKIKFLYIFKFLICIKAKNSNIIVTYNMIDTTPERHKARNFFTFRYFSFYEQLS